jgi:N-acetylmuramoyl-L-alanine amidase
VSIPPTARSGTLILRPAGQEREIPLAIGEIDPADTVSGAQGRLRDLGYNVGPIDGDLGPQTRTALKTFQKDHSLEVSGALDGATSDALIQHFGG